MEINVAPDCGTFFGKEPPMYVKDEDINLIVSYRKFLLEDGPLPDVPSDEDKRYQAFYAILRYVASYYLRWSPYELYIRLTPQVAKMFRLNALVSAWGLRKKGEKGYARFVLEAYPEEDLLRKINQNAPPGPK